MSNQKTRFDVIGQLGSLRRYARSLARNEQDAEDLVHDALVRAYEKQASFRPSGNLRTWLFSVLHNTFIDGFRSRQAEARRIAQAAEIAETVQQPSQEHAVRLEQIRQIFDTLPEEQRSALHLVAIEGLSYEEAAGILGIPIGTLMSRISRARASMRASEGEESSRAANLRIVGGRND
ncbi:sigma-70 family RNA polymerase sigma factor [Phyllobacterium sp. YR531]|uniref:sigma-70 family RNA polymerase sigma factor n=1 Tax=Phyllobacterium sp. YR531 TaxID=1144343 RepID=UPI00026F9844|nr:sigma-70 family RNA polymerase sigma factor [Phyllobacterium sp. YR531]EJN06101.1 RNA polymerase sigma factor, sigma-70 family [Phyllobacterium sp. YR531]